MDYNDKQNPSEPEPRHNVFSVIGLVLGILGVIAIILQLIDDKAAFLSAVSVIGLVFSIMGVVKAKKAGGKKILGIIGIVINSACILYWLVVLGLIIILILAFSNAGRV